jgi:hypothetical protein
MTKRLEGESVMGTWRSQAAERGKGTIKEEWRVSAMETPL